MRLYHFTAVEYLHAIRSEGITKGDVPLKPTKSINAVWLTKDDDPDAQGWAGTGEHVLTDEERALHARNFGTPLRAPDVRFPDKRAVKLMVDVPDKDPALIRWNRFARMRGI